MFTECANPNCAKAFDFREGFFYSFHKLRTDDESSDNALEVAHFWLCNQCAVTDLLGQLSGRGALIQVPFEKKLSPDSEFARAVD